MFRYKCHSVTYLYIERQRLNMTKVTVNEVRDFLQYVNVRSTNKANVYPLEPSVVEIVT